MKTKINRMSFGKKKNRIDVFHLNKPWKNGLAGMITSNLFQETVGIVVDEVLLSKNEADYACLGVSENGIAPRIVMTNDIFYDFKRGCPMARLVVFHELGHFIHGDLNESFHTASYDAERINIASQGKVIDVEVEADDFAVKYLGVDMVLSGFSALYNQVAQNEGAELALSEIKTRISIIKRNYLQTK